MYLRFVLPQRDRESHSRLGLLVAAHELRESGELEPYEDHLLGQALEWFNTRLPVPAILKQEQNVRALSWFTSSAQPAIDCMWDVVAVFRSYGATVELLKTDDPGTILYSDSWQVVAKPSRRDRARRRW